MQGRGPRVRGQQARRQISELSADRYKAIAQLGRGLLREEGGLAGRLLGAVAMAAFQGQQTQANSNLADLQAASPRLGFRLRQRAAWLRWPVVNGFRVILTMKLAGHFNPWLRVFR